MNLSPLACTTLKQSLVVTIAGVATGLIANTVSPRGISLTRDYFPGIAVGAAPANLTSTVHTKAPTAEPAIAAVPTRPAADAPAQLARSGIPLLGHARVLELFHDPRAAEARIVFVDARDDARFQAGHIPRAVQLDHYRLEKHIGEVFAACSLAEQIVVYCNGGDCEDSELAALDLLQLGIPATKLAVYRGGITEWESHRLPLETGARGSGNLIRR